VDKVLEGSVRKSGKRVRIAAQLINAMDGYHIWSEVYDRDLTDIFAVQDEISGIIASKLRENLTVNQKKEPLVKAATKNVTAYTYYLKGLHFWNKITPGDYYTAIRFFEQAISIEPAYAQAYAMAALAYTQLGSRGQMLPDEAFEIVHRYADKALDLDSSIAESHTAKAGAYLLYDWKWNEARDALLKAIDLNPAATEAYQQLGLYYLITGEKEKGVKVLEQAEIIDPLSPSVALALGNMYVFAKRYDESIQQAENCLKLTRSCVAPLK
jgi:TolB-like protein